jgi:radical SAM superfamily enzyme YgiQ (UPF0313 family)
MKVLLTNPPFFKVMDPVSLKSQAVYPMPPLGLMYLAAYLEKNSGHQVKILDCQVERLNFNQFKKRVQIEQPDIVGITTITFTLLETIKAIQIIKEINPRIKIVLGGPHIHIFPKESLELQDVDYVVLGEGEKPFQQLLDNLNNIKNLYSIKGIGFKDNNKIIVNNAHELIENLDTLPFPARHLTPYWKYRLVLSRDIPVTTMFTSRGCPYNCLFCDRPQLGKIFRARSAKNVVDEMEECEKMGIGEIFIYDDTFGVDRQRVLDICAEIKKRGLTIAWDIRTRVNTVDEEILNALKGAGCQRIHYGVEAGTQKILDVLRKGITLEMVEKTFKLTEKTGIQTLAYFMIGSPSETREDILATIEFAKKINPDFVHFTITTPYPATDLYRLGLEKGILPYDYWREFAVNPTRDFKPMVWEENLSHRELMILLKKAYRSFYWRPKYIFKTIKNIKSLNEFFRKAAEGLRIFKI